MAVNSFVRSARVTRHAYGQLEQLHTVNKVVLFNPLKSRLSQNQSHVTADGQSVRLDIEPLLGLMARSCSVY